MKKLAAVPILLWVVAGIVGAMLLSPPKEEIKQRVVGPSVQVAYFAGIGGAVARWQVAGSGTVFKTKRGTFVLTAGHVVDDAIEEVEGDIDPDTPRKPGEKRYKFNDVVIVVEREKDGIITGELRLRARIIKYSPVEEEGGDDLALLEPYEGDLLPYGARPLPPDAEVYAGQDVYHVGSLMGELVNSVSKGVIASTSRMYKNKPFYQLSATALPGSSGGGVFVVDGGRCYFAGVLTRGTGETVNLAVPINRVREALKRWNVEWLFTEAQ